MITPAQWRAARALLDWSQAELANKIGQPFVVVARLEAGSAPAPDEFAAEARATLEAAGVIFVEENGEGPGVRLRKSQP